MHTATIIQRKCYISVGTFIAYVTRDINRFSSISGRSCARVQINVSKLLRRFLAHSHLIIVVYDPPVVRDILDVADVVPTLWDITHVRDESSQIVPVRKKKKG